MADESNHLARTVRQELLELHKALLDAERAEYERASGAATAPAALLQMLIADPKFAWLRHISRLIVAMDEALSVRKPAPSEKVEELLGQTRGLLGDGTEADDFHQKYRAALAASSGAARLHANLITLLAR